MRMCFAAILGLSVACSGKPVVMAPSDAAADVPPDVAPDVRRETSVMDSRIDVVPRDAADSRGEDARADASPCLSGGVDGGAIHCPGYSNTRVIDLDWSSGPKGSSILAYSSSVGGFGGNDALVVRFTTPATTSPNLGHIGVAEYTGPPTFRVAKLSCTACDFGGGSPCQSPEDYFSVGSNSVGAASLAPSTTYYFNVHNVGCSGVCDVIVTLQKPTGL
jgi:hypothetical protein